MLTTAPRRADPNSFGRSAYSDLLIGTSGFSYEHWRHGEFYPEGLRVTGELQFYASNFPTVELNNPFYRLPERSVFERWRSQTPDNFVFAVKASRYITHIKRLKDCNEPLERLMDRVGGLGAKLGPILFQFPANWRLHLDSLTAFLKILPRNLRYTFEFRNREWYSKPVWDLLAKYGAAFCIPVAENLPSAPEVVTANFVYIRMHAGSGAGGNFTTAALHRWAKRIERFLQKRLCVYVYFNNDSLGNAVRNAATIGEMLGWNSLLLESKHCRLRN